MPNALDPFFDFLHETTAEEELWNPAPAGQHGHKKCRACGDDVIVFVFSGKQAGDTLFVYRSNEPRSGPLAHVVATDEPA